MTNQRSPVKQHGWFPIETRGQTDGRYRIRIMTDQVARDGDIVDPMGMEVEHYLRNPVVMWAHDYVGHTSAAGLPIGRTLALSRSPRGIDVEFEFLPGDAFAERVANAWNRGFLRTASIGWESLQTVPLPGRHGVCHRRSELLEWSIVPIPADPGASRELFTAGMRSMGFGDLLNDEGASASLPSNEGIACGPSDERRHRDGATTGVHHPPLGQLVAELEDLWDYIKARAGAGIRSERLSRSIERLAREMTNGSWDPREAPLLNRRTNGDDTAGSVGMEELLLAAQRISQLVSEE